MIFRVVVSVINLLKIETRPSSLLNFGMANYVMHTVFLCDFVEFLLQQLLYIYI